MADNKTVRDGDNAAFVGAADELSDGSFSPKVSLLDGTTSPAPISPATSGLQSTLNTSIGATNESAAGSDTATSGLNGRLQRIAQRLTSLIALLPAALSGGGNLRVSLAETETSITGISGSGSDGFSNTNSFIPAQGSGTARLLSVAQYAFNGSTWDRQRGNTTGTIVIPPAGWSYAAASGGIDTSTTAVTLAAAAGSGVRNYLQSLQIDHDTLGAATEIVVRDGAGGTVIWRGKLQTAAVEGAKVNFNPPLRSSANTLLEFACVSAVTGDVLVNAQGYTAP